MAQDGDIAIDELPRHLKRGARLLGLDVGSKTIGLALSDLSRTVATPFDTIRRTRFTDDVRALLRVAEVHGVCAYIVGLPIKLDGSEGPRAQSTRAFVRNLTRHTALPVVFWDERWSTAAVERTLLEADASRKRRAEVIDKMAAAYILQGALDRLAHLTDGCDRSSRPLRE